MDEEKAKIREVLLECYGVDIDEAKCHFSTQNYAFIFPNHPYMIRVSKTPKKTRKEILSELMWVDDLKQFKQTICEPSISLKGNLLEEFEIDDVSYRASMFRAARGNIQVTTEMTPMFFICVGELLGMIHHVSTDEREIGMNYQRRTLKDSFSEQKKKIWDKLEPDVQNRINIIEEKVNSLPKSIGIYGLCHGDFHANNFFVEANNIWLFDFDGCCYANYLYDVASFIQACFISGFGKGKDCRKVIHEEIMPYFKLGYGLNHKCDEHYWDNLPLLFSYRAAYAAMMLAEIDTCGMVNSLVEVKKFFSAILQEDDIYEGLTKAMCALAIVEK
ncbi:MAG: phosphotransferase [Lachnospiraceae bacterium]|nr:phosphotransferase [Lachnospiraceae bacterium]